MRIDLHTHSSVSDGTDRPGDLVRAARAAGVDVLALTDHDTAEGWEEAAAVAREVGLQLVPGMEISTQHHGQSVHLLAYLPDPHHPELAAQLEAIVDGRDARVPAMVGRLQELGHPITVADVLAQGSRSAAAGRPHVADALVAIGVVRSRDEAFSRFLSTGGPAYVRRYAPPLPHLIRTVTDAGGVSVLAHPWGRTEPSGLDEAGIAELVGAGLAGLEVDHEDHDPGARARLRAIARDLGLVVTGSSDHHGTGKVGHPLGCNTTAVEEYERLLELADLARRRSGRTPPRVVNR